ncbi:MAG: hypothetical protein MUP47_08415 [Phycisphaerae bacterium]|nr:hypothetical protein [Phycisphaerae bacterium]
MRSFLERISSRKFLTAFAVQLAGLVALLRPAQADQLGDAAVRIAALVVMVLAALGYGKLEAALDSSASANNDALP